MMFSGSHVVQDKLACACVRDDDGDQPWRYAIKIHNIADAFLI